MITGTVFKISFVTTIAEVGNVQEIQERWKNANATDRLRLFERIMDGEHFEIELLEVKLIGFE